ncbi:hypothetical protein AAKU55_001953 [Oxalobacteraceae bacterium GrIS 1.11]
MKLRYSIALGVPLLSASALAADLALTLEIPQLNVAEYHRPYVALWLETTDQKVLGNLALWYDVKKKDNGGAKYLKDMRQWWRKSGRDSATPLDGISGATRAPGEYKVNLPGAKALLDTLPAGQYELVVEAAREAGGRELLRLPFQWPPKAALSIPAKGREELGALALQLKP